MSREEITPEASKRICDHMNEDHGVSLYAMAKTVLEVKPGWKMTEVRLQSISLTGCKIQAFICSGDLCEMARGEYPFHPPLQSPSEVRKRMIEIHNQVMSPQLLWIVTNPVNLFVASVLTWLGYIIHVVGVPGFISSMDSTASPQHYLAPLNKLVTYCFGSVTMFAESLRVLFFFLVGAHGLEALYGVYHCRNTLSLGLKQQLLWFIMLLFCGVPVLSELTDLVKFAEKMQKEKIKKTS